MQINEELQPIKGYEGMYSVDRKGNVFSHKNNKYLSLKSQNCRGYIQVGLYKDGKVKMFCVHKLVAMTFIPNPNNYSVVDHIDGNKQHNSIENLEWVTQKENVHRCIAKGQFSKMKYYRQ